MRNNKEYKDEIFYSECCGLCKHFSGRYYSIECSLTGLCFHKTRLSITGDYFKVNYHNWCTKFELNEECRGIFGLDDVKKSEV